jgi:hypothetical protein
LAGNTEAYEFGGSILDLDRVHWAYCLTSPACDARVLADYICNEVPEYLWSFAQRRSEMFDDVNIKKCSF